MTQEDYIKTHPEQFKDDIDRWLFLEFGIIGGCCSAEKSHEYHIARMVAEKLNGTFIEKACEFFSEYLCEYIDVKNANCDTFVNVDGDKLKEDFKNYMIGE